MKILKILLCLLSLYLPLNGRLLDVQISLDASEESARKPVTMGVGLALCQKSSPVITTSHIFYNIMKARYESDLIYQSMPLHEWDIYRTIPDREFYLFIPNNYIQKITVKYDNAQFRQEVAKTVVKDTAQEILIGFKIDPSSNVLEKVDINQFNTLQKIQTIKNNYYDVNPGPIYNIFTKGKNDLYGTWNMVLDGHGYYASDMLAPNLTMDMILQNMQGSSASVVGLKMADFRNLMQFFIKEINVNFLYYLSCYAGDINLVLPYVTALTNTKGNIVGQQKPNFTVAAGSVTNEPVTVNIRQALTLCHAKINKIDFPTGLENYGLFFELIHKYSKENGVTIYNDKELREILAAITPRYKYTDDPHGISGLPAVMFPNTDTVRSVSLSDKIVVISNVLIKKHELENKPIILKDKEAILIYPKNIIPELKINIGNYQQAPAFVSMIPGVSLNKFESIETNIKVNDFFRFFLGSAKPVFNKYFYIKKLTLNNSGINSLQGFGSGNIELKDVLIALKALKDSIDIVFFYTAPDSSVNVYQYYKDGSLPQIKSGNKVNEIPEYDFLNAYLNYFNFTKKQNEIRQDFNFNSLKNLLSPEEKKILKTKQSIISNLVRDFPNVMTNPNQLNSAGQLPLNVAIANNEPIDDLIELGAEVNNKDANGNTPLITAAKNNNASAFQTLLANPQTNIFVENNEKQNAIQVAKATNNINIQQQIINKYMPSTIFYSSPNMLTDQAQLNDALGSLMYYYNKGEATLNTYKILIYLGANINAKRYNMTPLMDAAYYGKKDLVIFLLDNGANPNIADSYGYTAVKWAQLKGYNDIAQIIENRGKTQTINPPSIITPSPINQARFNQTIRQINIFINVSKQIRSIKNEKRKKQLTARLRNIRRRIINQFDLNIRNNLGQTPLMVRPDLIPFLRELPRNKKQQIVNAKDNNNKTILNYLMDSKFKLNVQLYRILINSGAKATRADIAKFRKTPQKGPRFKQILQILRKSV